VGLSLAQNRIIYSLLPGGALSPQQALQQQGAAEVVVG